MFRPPPETDIPGPPRVAGPLGAAGTRGAAGTLERLADGDATGALHTGTGTLYLVAGAVVHAESDMAPGLARLLAACGRIPPDVWASTVGATEPEHRSGRLMVEQHLLSRGELELCHLNSLYDAAYFALDDASAVTFFEPGVLHWLGTVNKVTARRLRRSTLRRREVLDRAWPWPDFDTSAVRYLAPLTRSASGIPPRRRVLLDHMDGRRTPVDLALLLGRSTYATMLEVRRLAATGLVVTVTARGLQRRTPGATIPAQTRAKTRAPTQSQSQTQFQTQDRPTTGRPPDQVRDPYHARHRAADPLSVPDPDVALLTRVLTALEARL